MKSINSKLVLAGLAVVVSLVAACSNGSNSMTGNGKGAVQFVMTSSGTAPVAAATTGGAGSGTDVNLQSANVTFASILARNLDGQLIDVTIELPVTVDVLGMGSGAAITLPAGFLPPGTYDQLVIVITALELTLGNGTVVTIEPPGGGWTAIVPVTEPFTVVEGQTTTVTIQFRRDTSFRWLDGEWMFDPDFECRGDRGDQDGDDDGDDD